MQAYRELPTKGVSSGNGRGVARRSSCGSYAYMVIDCKDEYVEFLCK